MPGPRVDGAILSVDGGRAAAHVGHGEVLAVHVAHTEAAQLHEAVPEAHAYGLSRGAMPEAEIGPGPWMQSSMA